MSWTPCTGGSCDVPPVPERALRHIQCTRAVYQYGRFPQRYVLGVAIEQVDMSQATAPLAAFADAFHDVRPDFGPMVASMASIRRNVRSHLVVGDRP